MHSIMPYIFMLPLAILIPAIHEFTKALTSTLLGDPTPRENGRLSLNPFKHFEPIGFFLVLIFYGYGWGQPTPTAALHYRNRPRGVFLTYFVPVLVNLFLGIGSIAMLGIFLRGGFLTFDALAATARFGDLSLDPGIIVFNLLYFSALMNINFALFNLIPIYPLAMHRIMLLFSRPENIARFNHNEKNMQFLLMFGLAFGIVPMILSPASQWIIETTWRFFI